MDRRDFEQLLSSVSQLSEAQKQQLVQKLTLPENTTPSIQDIITDEELDMLLNGLRDSH